MNIYHRKDGRWEGRIYNGSSEKKPKYKAFFGTTKEIVKKKIDDFKTKHNRSLNVTVFKITQEWLKSIIHHVKESTIANYKLKLEKHILPAFGNIFLEDITQNDIYNFIDLKQKSGLSNRYITDIIVLIKTIIKYSVRKYNIVNPIEGIKLPKKIKSEIKLLTDDEERILMQIINKNQNLTSLGIILSRFMGLRIGELCALKWSDVNLKANIITVNKTIQRIQCRNSNNNTKLIITEPKSESSQRVIPIPKCIVKLLNKFKSEEDKFVLSGTIKPVEPRTMQYRFAKILKNGNLPSVHFHSLRHSFASQCIRLGFDIKSLSEILGHSSVEITLNQYVHSFCKQKIEYMNRFNLD